MEAGGYAAPSWICQTCQSENAAKWHRVNTNVELARIRAQETLNRDWGIGSDRRKKEGQNG